MNTYPFTESGFEELQLALYSLGAAELQEQAAQVSTNFTNWIIDHFDLTEDQLSYLNLIDERVISFLAFQTSFAVANKLPVVLIKPLARRDPDQGKLIIPKSNLSAASANGNFEPGGELIIEVVYNS